MLPERLFVGQNVVLFEDDGISRDLFPMSVMRPAWEIRCGAACLRHWLASLGSPGTAMLFRPRMEMKEIAIQLAGRNDDTPDPESETLFVNGRLIALWQSDPNAPDLPETVVDGHGRVMLARRNGAAAADLLSLSGNELAERLVQESKGESLPPGWTMLAAGWVWDYVLHNPVVLERQLRAEARALPELLGAHTLRDLPSGAHVTDPRAGNPVYVGSGVRIMPGAVIGNHTGPVWIGSQTELEPHTYLEGPLYIGPHCRIKAGTRLYGGCAFGPQTRVGGEILGTVIQGYSNKQHDGFLGQSFLGEWVNLGADTVCSNLRNDYGTVKVKLPGLPPVDTGQQYVGLMCGDHVKTGINTMFNTGTVVGVGANVYGGGYPPRFVPSFAWGGADGFHRGDLERTLKTARVVAQRRGRELTTAEENLLRGHYALTMNQESLS